MIERENIQPTLRQKKLAACRSGCPGLVRRFISFRGHPLLQKVHGRRKSNGWKFVFYSEVKNMLYEVVVKGRRIAGRRGKRNGKKALQTPKRRMTDRRFWQCILQGNPLETEIFSLKMVMNTQSKKLCG